MPRKSEPIRPLRERPDARRSLAAALNLGPQSSVWLIAAGIKSLSQVRELGPIGVCRRLRESGRPVSVVMAYALEGALTGCHWNAIPWETKQFLQGAFARMRKNSGPATRARRSTGSR
ncbi:MAG: TfoX/Sxy family protein [Opitutae bacterium]|nr:TfoX/Sxy family protein [Opitutae bacterium]